MAISLASAFPQSTIVGVDLDPFSIARAEGVAASLSLPNLRFVCVSVRHHLLPTPACCVCLSRSLLPSEGHG